MPANLTVAVAGYEVLEKLGEGGMGIVYKARDVKLNRLVALKMVQGVGTVAQRSLIRFLAEAESVAAIQHPNVVRVYEYGETDGRPYMSLEYCPGGTLAEHLRNGRLEARKAAGILSRIAAGVGAAHELGTIHRDVKPGNVLFDLAGEPKIADFGLAKRITGLELTRTREVMGTPFYMAPEQAGGANKFVGPPADVWALGVMLYELLAGTRPFDAESTEEILARVILTTPAPLQQMVPGLPRDLELICRKCLEKNPADRYPSANELADDLNRFVAGEPISVRPAGLVERLYKWVRRKPILAAVYGLTGLLVVLIGLIVGAVWLWRDAEQRGAQAEQNRQQAESLRDHEANQRIQELLQSVSASEGEALERFRTGRFGEARKTLDDVLARLPDEARLSQRRIAIRTRRNQASHLEHFYAHADRAWYIVGDEDLDWQPVLMASRRALQELGILTQDGAFANNEWWRDLPDADLGDEQQGRLRGEIYQQILLIALVHIREGAVPLLSPKSTDQVKRNVADHFRRSLTYVNQARAWERSQQLSPTRSILLTKKAIGALASLAGDKETSGRAAETEAAISQRQSMPDQVTSAELFFDGILHFFLSTFEDNAVKLAMEFYLKLDGTNAKPRAAENLRRAAILEPKRFWHQMMAGWSLLNNEDFVGAELAFTDAIRIRDRDPRGYLFRATTLVQRATQKTGKSPRLPDDVRKKFIALGRSDLARARELDPLIPDVHWLGGKIHSMLNEKSEAIEAYARYMEIEDRRLPGRLVRGNYLNDVDRYLKDLLATDPTEPNALAARALLQLRRLDSPGAFTAAEKSLNHPRGLAVRGTVLMQRGDWRAALVDFDAAIRTMPQNYLAAIGRGLAYEAGADLGKSLSAYDTTLGGPAGASATAKWQQAEAHHGRFRVLTRLNRTAEAQLSLQRAREIDVNAVIYLETNSPVPLR